ncbi:Geraniol synthase [Melia azedarach]|uniref:Geraniol synthase n=1 Tax=Melia azedarach TaxID=155640 RepID=A0ACC1Z223_MELAZ|nr:Geraniol synthase [Melia azedarach]
MAASSRISLGSGSLISFSARQTRRSLHANSSLCSMCQLSSMPKPLFTDFNSLPHQKVLTFPVDDHGTSKSLEELHDRTREALRKSTYNDPVAGMKFIDTIQRLGIGYQFEEDISEHLERFSNWNADGEDLFVNALRFRLLRHNGFPASPEIFKKFINKDGRLKKSMSKDTRGILSLYEASYLATHGEDILLQAMEFTRTQLTQSMSNMTPNSRRLVVQALQLPRHLRMARLEAGNYINEYSREWNHNPTLLELAKLDFNMVQSSHQRELAEIHRWWKHLGLVDKLGFGRDRPLECFLWTVGIFPDPRYSNCRIELTKTIALLLVIDDIFDTYGSLSDLVLFTDTIQRWDLGAMEQIPEYMQICFMALYNTTNEISYRILKEHGWNVVPQLKRTWVDIFEAQLAEAKWFSEGYVPTQEQYLTNGVTTGGTYMALVHAFFLMGQGVTKETCSLMEPYPNLFSCSGKILRLWDDLGTAREEQERGDVASSIECYMREQTVSCEEAARKHVRQLIRSLWVELNGVLMDPAAALLPLSIVNASLNLARTAQVVYQHGDDSNVSSVNEHVQTLFYNPIK